MEDQFINSKKPLFDGTDPYRVYYIAFGDTNDADKNLLPYEEEIQDQKEVKVNEYFIEALDHYTGSKVVVPGKYYIPVLSWVKLRKRNSLGNPIDEEHSKPILDTRIYEL